jgi:hypothetical protein
MKVLYNSDKDVIIGFFKNGYKIDGINVEVEPPIFELDYIEMNKQIELPDHITSKLSLSPKIDLKGKKYIKEWLLYIKHDPPKHNPETQRLIKLPPKIDKRKKTYTEGWKVVDLTHYEIAMKDWQFPEYEFRITAPIQLVLDDFGVKMKGWFELKGLPVVATETTVQLWCAEVQPQFQETVEGLVKQGVIQVDKRPEK